MNILAAEHLRKAYTAERILLEDASFSLQEGEKVGVIGVNGMGKSTLLKLIAGVEEPDGGAVVMGNHVKTAYLEQTPVPEDTDSILQAALKGLDVQDGGMEGEAKSMLHRLGFSDVRQPVKHLSGGQKKRVALVNVLLQPVEILILDEPTNHLDIISREILEDALNNYTGTLLYVSHDRYFINRTATRILDLTNQSLVNYMGNYDYYMEKREELTARYAPSQETEETSQGISQEKLTWQQKKEEQARQRKRANDLKKTEARIDELEGRNEQINQLLSQPEIATDPEQCGQLSLEQADIQQELENLYELWEQLAED